MSKSRKRSSPKISWSKKLTMFRALSIRQPWAWLIVNGYKDVENRSWRTRYRGPILIHSALSTRDLRDGEAAKVARRFGIRMPREYERGGIVGAAEVVDCRTRTGSPWHRRGQIGWVMAKPRRLSFRECKGSLGLFRPEFK
jgi:ASCH domain